MSCEAFHTTETQRREWAPGYDTPAALKRRPLLDAPSEPHPLLTLKMDDLLTRILLVSDGAVSSYVALEIVKQSVDRTNPMQRALAAAPEYDHAGKRADSESPESTLATIVHDLDVRFEQCRTNRQRLLVIKDAQEIDVRLRYAPNRSKVRGTKEWREAVANDSRDSGTIAIDYKINLRMVQRIRKEFGTNRPRGGDQTTRVARHEQTT